MRAQVQVLALNKPGRGPAPTSSAPYDPAPDLPPYTSSSSEGEEETDGDSEGESEHNNTGIVLVWHTDIGHVDDPRCLGYTHSGT